MEHENITLVWRGLLSGSKWQITLIFVYVIYSAQSLFRFFKTYFNYLKNGLKMAEILCEGVFSKYIPTRQPTFEIPQGFNFYFFWSKMKII